MLRHPFIRQIELLKPCVTLWQRFYCSSTPFRHEAIRSNNQLCTGDSGQLVWISPILSVQQAWQPLVANTDHPWPPLVHWSLVLPSTAFWDSTVSLQVPKPFGLKTMEVGLAATKHHEAGIADGRVVVPLLCSGCTSATTGYLVTWLDLAAEMECWCNVELRWTCGSWMFLDVPRCS